MGSLKAQVSGREDRRDLARRRRSADRRVVRSASLAGPTEGPPAMTARKSRSGPGGDNGEREPAEANGLSSQRSQPTTGLGSRMCAHFGSSPFLVCLARLSWRGP